MFPLGCMFDLNSRGFSLTASRGERRTAHTRVSTVVSIKKEGGDRGDNAKGDLASGDGAHVKADLNSDKGELVRRGFTRGKCDNSLDCAQVRALGHSALVDKHSAGLQLGNGATMGTRQGIDSMLDMVNDRRGKSRALGHKYSTIDKEGKLLRVGREATNTL
jgi:hypothetical protein